MPTLTSLMLIELAKTDHAMKWAVKHNRPDVYNDVFNERLGVISYWMDRPKLTTKEFLKLTIY